MIDQRKEITLDMPNGRPKGTSIQTNTIFPIISVKTWTFLCGGFLPAMEICEDGTILYGGYTIQELQEFADADEAEGNGGENDD